MVARLTPVEAIVYHKNDENCGTSLNEVTGFLSIIFTLRARQWFSNGGGISTHTDHELQIGYVRDTYLGQAKTTHIEPGVCGWSKRPPELQTFDHHWRLRYST